MAYYIRCPKCRHTFNIRGLLQDRNENKVIPVRCPTKKQFKEDDLGCGESFLSYCFEKSKVGYVGNFPNRENPSCPIGEKGAEGKDGDNPPTTGEKRKTK